MDTSDTPAYYLGYHVQETAAGNIWTHVATAWPSPNDQGGFTVTLQASHCRVRLCFSHRQAWSRPLRRKGTEGKVGDEEGP